MGCAGVMVEVSVDPEADERQQQETCLYHSSSRGGGKQRSQIANGVPHTSSCESGHSAVLSTEQTLTIGTLWVGDRAV